MMLDVGPADFFAAVLWCLCFSFRPDLALQMSDMVSQLCSLSKGRVILSFAPNTWYYSILKKVGVRGGRGRGGGDVESIF